MTDGATDDNSKPRVDRHELPDEAAAVGAAESTDENPASTNSDVMQGPAVAATTASAGGDSGDDDAESAESLSDGVLRHLSPRNVVLDRQVRWIRLLFTSLLSGGIMFLIWQFAPLPGTMLFWLWTLWGTGTVANAVNSTVWPPVAHRFTTYRVNADAIEIRRGVFWRTVSSVPRSRVQHIDVSQGPLERTHGLATLTMYTAGSSFASVSLSGLENDRALRLREHLLPRFSDDAV